MIAPQQNDQEQAHLDALVAMASKVDEALGEMCCDDTRRDFVQDLFNYHDVVWCLWHVGKIIHAKVVKGSNVTGYVAETAIIVSDESGADHMRAILGDNRPATTHEASWSLM